VTQPDWAKIQKTDERSPFHGRRDSEHGPNEHGMGAQEEHPQGKPFRFLAGSGFVVPVGVDLETAPEDTLAGLTSFPSSYYIPYVPPVTDQGSTPQCVAYSSAYDQNQNDRYETGRFWNFDEAAFFRHIGGTADGSSMTVALSARVSWGMPEQDSTPNPGIHRIKSSLLLDRTVTAFKSAIVNRRSGVLRIGPWFHSWFHPLSSGKLPAPDYLVGWHATWLRGYNDSYGGRIRNSWGTAYGLSGDVFMPYTYLTAAGSMWATTDR